MIELKLNTEALEFLKKEGFYTDTLLTKYFILECLNNNSTFWLNLLDDNMTSKRFVLQYYELVKRGLIEESATIESFSITEKGRMFLDTVNQLKNPIVPKIKNVSVDIKVEDWISDWLELFPKGVKTGGKLLRSDKMGCLKKMEKFVKESGYSSELIKAATSAYLEEREVDDYKYCKCATYFIDKKGEGSELAAWCEQIKDEPQIKKDDFIINTNGGLI